MLVPLFVTVSTGQTVHVARQELILHLLFLYSVEIGNLYNCLYPCKRKHPKSPQSMENEGSAVR